MDRRYFLRSVLGLSALRIAESASSRVPVAEPADGGTLLAEAASPTAQGQAPQDSIALSSGLRDLDRLTNGLAPGSLIVVASRPSMGKSLLVFQIADQIARAERRAVAIVCAQDGVATVAERLVSVRTGVWPRHFHIQRDGGEMASSVALAQVATVPILLDDTPGLTVGEIANRTTRFVSERSVPLGAIIVDGIDVLVSGRGRSASDCVTAQLRSLARGLGVPVIITAQVNRAVEQRQDHRPRVTDFNDPYAAFVRAADMVITIYRDEIYHIDSPDAGLAELTLFSNHIRKQGMVKVRLREGRFRDS